MFDPKFYNKKYDLEKFLLSNLVEVFVLSDQKCYPPGLNMVRLAENIKSRMKIIFSLTNKYGFFGQTCG